jgi:polyphosphate glucokinase
VDVLGVDIGGSGVKGAPVNIQTGELLASRYRIPTPQPSSPKAVADVVGAIAKHFEWRKPIGITFPGVIHHGVIMTAANVDKSWIGVDGIELFENATQCRVRILNDADAAGLAEMELGAGRNHHTGVVIMLTFGTGIGTAIFVNGHLLPNTEFGHLPLRGKDAEHRAAARVRDDENLTWTEWAERVNEFLAAMEFFFSPDLFIIGGGISKKQHKFMHHLKSRAEIAPAQLLNDAGIIGAATVAKELATATP